MSTAPAKQDSAAKAGKSAVTAKTTAKAPAAEQAVKPGKSPRSAPAPRVRKPAAAKRPQHAESRLAQVLMAPIVSEKATLISEKRNQVTFQVLRDATKPEIKAAVELMFKVNVTSVQTALQKGKVKKFGRSIGRRDHVKKAYVSLAAGQELNFSGEGA